MSSCVPGITKPILQVESHFELETSNGDKACQACVRLRLFLSNIPFYHESVVYILIS